MIAFSVKNHNVLVVKCKLENAEFEMIEVNSTDRVHAHDPWALNDDRWHGVISTLPLPKHAWCQIFQNSKYAPKMPHLPHGLFGQAHEDISAS